ncbi:MAG TPA: hypothetical protein VK475_09355 [Pyrinomonadaceae bacterium]|nr:hypothetical protein [Pyrinomonadaceae bacterium]
MNFNCLFRRTKFSGNLFVQHAGDDQLHYFELARRQQTKTAPSFILFCTAPTLFGGPSQGALNTSKQVIIAKRLWKKIDRTCLHRLSTHRDVAMAGNKNELFFTAALNQSFLQIHTV